MYKEEVEVSPLAMVDNIVTISECGPKTTAINAFIDTKACCKKLQFGVKKYVRNFMWAKPNPKLGVKISKLENGK